MAGEATKDVVMLCCKGAHQGIGIDQMGSYQPPLNFCLFSHQENDCTLLNGTDSPAGPSTDQPQAPLLQLFGFMHLNEGQCINTGRTSSAISGTKQGRQLTQAQPGGHEMRANVLSQTSFSLPGFSYCSARYWEGTTGDSSWEPEEARRDRGGGLK